MGGWMIGATIGEKNGRKGKKWKVQEKRKGNKL